MRKDNVQRFLKQYLLVQDTKHISYLHVALERRCISIVIMDLTPQNRAFCTILYF